MNYIIKYNSTVDGCNATTFAKKIKTWAPTLMIMKTTKGQVTAGYTNIFWNASTNGKQQGWNIHQSNNPFQPFWNEGTYTWLIR